MSKVKVTMLVKVEVEVETEDGYMSMDESCNLREEFYNSLPDKYDATVEDSYEDIIEEEN